MHYIYIYHAIVQAKSAKCRDALCVCDTVMRVDAVTSSYCVDYYRFYIYISIMYISSRVN